MEDTGPILQVLSEREVKIDHTYVVPIICGKYDKAREFLGILDPQVFPHDLDQDHMRYELALIHELAR